MDAGRAGRRGRMPRGVFYNWKNFQRPNDRRDIVYGTLERDAGTFRLNQDGFNADLLRYQLETLPSGVLLLSTHDNGREIKNARKETYANLKALFYEKSCHPDSDAAFGYNGIGAAYFFRSFAYNVLHLIGDHFIGREGKEVEERGRKDLDGSLHAQPVVACIDVPHYLSKDMSSLTTEQYITYATRTQRVPQYEHADVESLRYFIPLEANGDPALPPEARKQELLSFAEEYVPLDSLPEASLRGFISRHAAVKGSYTGFSTLAIAPHGIWRLECSNEGNMPDIMFGTEDKDLCLLSLRRLYQTCVLQPCWEVSALSKLLDNHPRDEVERSLASRIMEIPKTHPGRSVKLQIQDGEPELMGQALERVLHEKWLFDYQVKDTDGGCLAVVIGVLARPDVLAKGMADEDVWYESSPVGAMQSLRDGRIPSQNQCRGALVFSFVHNRLVMLSLHCNDVATYHKGRGKPINRLEVWVHLATTARQHNKSKSKGTARGYMDPIPPVALQQELTAEDKELIKELRKKPYRDIANELLFADNSKAMCLFVFAPPKLFNETKSAYKNFQCDLEKRILPEALMEGYFRRKLQDKKSEIDRQQEHALLSKAPVQPILLELDSQTAQPGRGPTPGRHGQRRPCRAAAERAKKALLPPSQVEVINTVAPATGRRKRKATPRKATPRKGSRQSALASQGQLGLSAYANKVIEEREKTVRRQWSEHVNETHRAMLQFQEFRLLQDVASSSSQATGRFVKVAYQMEDDGTWHQWLGLIMGMIIPKDLPGPTQYSVLFSGVYFATDGTVALTSAMNEAKLDQVTPSESIPEDLPFGSFEVMPVNFKPPKWEEYC